MKSALGSDVDPDFSFSPNEISSFIAPQANQVHARHEENGRAAFERAIPIFRERIEFARAMATRLRDGMLDCERTPHGGYELGDDRNFICTLASEAASKHGYRISLSADLHLRSCAADGAGSSVRAARVNDTVAPTPQEFEEINATRQASPPWAATDDDWHCTICDRSKIEFARKSNRNRWTAGVQKLNSFAVERDHRNLTYRSRRQTADLVLRSHVSYLVCQDCRQIVTDAARSGGSEDCFRPEDLRLLVGTPTPNRAHGVSYDQIRDALHANADWQAAARDYWAHYGHAIKVAAHFGLLLSRGFSRQSAQEAMGLSCDANEFDWLVEEASRLKQESST